VRPRAEAALKSAGRGVGHQPGLLGALVAAVRVEFRQDDLVFDPRDPVFGNPPCAVPRCARPARERGMCVGHRQRWVDTGKPDLAVFFVTTKPGWVRTQSSTVVRGAGAVSVGTVAAAHAIFSSEQRGTARPEAWRMSAAPLLPLTVTASCLIAYCDYRAAAGSAEPTTGAEPVRQTRCGRLRRALPRRRPRRERTHRPTATAGTADRDPVRPAKSSR
jgi:hypothetical protein